MNAADIVCVAPGIYSVVVDGRSYEVRIDGAEVYVGGKRLHIEIQDPRKWNPNAAGRRGEGRESIKSPMPGKIVRILASVGTEVAAHQGIVVVEAMKMQNELKTPRAGRVIEIRVSEGETVAAGAVLAVIE